MPPRQRRRELWQSDAACWSGYGRKADRVFGAALEWAEIMSVGETHGSVPSGQGYKVGLMLLGLGVP